MRIFKSRWFQRFARRELIDDASLIEAIGRAERGLVDALLGGDVIKQRVARAGQGKSKGYRTIIFYQRGERAFFMFGFAKSDLANVSRDEVEDFKKAAKLVLALEDGVLRKLIERGDFQEVEIP